MTNETHNKAKAFEAAPDESWWYCENPSCHCAFQKAECQKPGQCPYCEGEIFNNAPWDSAMLDNPHFPRIPKSGQTYVG